MIFFLNNQLYTPYKFIINFYKFYNKIQKSQLQKVYNKFTNQCKNIICSHIKVLSDIIEKKFREALNNLDYFIMDL